MPRTAEQNEEIRQARIQQILDAAIHVYVEKGVRGAEIGEIAEQAGIARGLVYHYYKDKVALFQDLFERSMASAKQFVQVTLAATDLPPKERLVRYTREFIRLAVENPHYVRFYRNLEYDVPIVFGDEAMTVMKEFQAGIAGPVVETLAQAMREGQIRQLDSQLVASVFWGSIMGAMNQFLHRQAAGRMEERIEDAIVLIFKGLETGGREETERNDNK